MKLPFSNWRDWELNPVVVKELRQSVRSWAVTGMLMVFLVVLFLTSIGFLIGQSFTISPSQMLGREIFIFYLMILTGACVLFIPVYIAVRVAGERQDNNVDLLYITTLSPGRIIRGKLLCGVYLTVLYFSACMPFMVLTNQLRGVDLPTIFVILVMVFLLVVFAIQFAIFLACLPVSRNAKILLAMPAVVGALGLFGTLGFASTEMIQSGVGSLLGTWRFWGPALTALIVGGMVFGLFYLMSVALITPHSANRALPLRIYVTALWAISGVVATSWAMVNTSANELLPWASLSVGVLIIALLCSVSEHDTRSIRVQRTIPTDPRKRLVAFFFFGGAAGGIAWSMLLLGATLIVLRLLDALQASWLGTGFLTEINHFCNVSQIVGLYAFSYSLTAMFIHRQFLAHKPPVAAGILALLLPGLWAIVPNVVLFFMNELSWSALERLQLGNVFNVFIAKAEDNEIYHLGFAFFWAVAAIVLNARWFARQVAHFIPYRAAATGREPGGAATRI